MVTDPLSDGERERRWEVIERIGARNQHFDPEDVERDIAEAIAGARAEERAKKAAATPRR
jgi:hypothetical protein